VGVFGSRVVVPLAGLFLSEFWLFWDVLHLRNLMFLF
jgi:hypothetical protein